MSVLRVRIFNALARKPLCMFVLKTSETTDENFVSTYIDKCPTSTIFKTFEFVNKFALHL